MIIQIDTREKNNKNIVDYFDKINQKYFRSKCYVGDYVNSESNKVVIDIKQSGGSGLLELCNNLCTSTGHQRIKNEIERAKEIGCERFIFLVCDYLIKDVKQVNQWFVPQDNYYQPRTKVKPETLQKIMMTMMEKYEVEFIFVPKNEAGRKIVELLNVGGD